MALIDGQRGTVIAPRTGSAWVDVGGRVLKARNGLNTRVPPGSKVIVVVDRDTHTWSIVGRER